jgi:uncharacterized protein
VVARPGKAGSEMLLSIEALEDHSIDFREEFPPEVIDLGSDVRQQGMLRTAGHVDLIEEQLGRKQKLDDIHVAGELSACVELLCARCLEPVVTDVKRSFDLLYRPRGSDAGREELSVTQAEADIGYYVGEGVLLEDILREQVLLAVPLKVVCSEDCKGLCPRCGQNLNQGACACSEPGADERWTALKDLKDKLK